VSTADAEAGADLVEALLPDAAGLAVAVREEPREQIAARLAGLSRHELETLAVVLAAMVDPDQPIARALAWVDFDEYGEPLQSPTESIRHIRQAARPQRLDRNKGIDMAKVERALRGEPMGLTTHERTAAVDKGIRRGMGYDEVASVLGMSRDAVLRSWDRVKQRARANGQYVPPVAVGEIAA
jgi:hypothetical protein